MHFHTHIVLGLLGLATASPVAPRSSADTAAAPAGCAEGSFHGFAWEARDIDFHASYIFTNPAHQNSWGYVSFDLFNPADQSTAHCEAASNQLSDFFYGTVQYNCNDTARSGRTSFDFSRPASQLRIEQSWTCWDQDPQYPITFTARGDANLTLDCTDETWTNPDWELGQIYSSRTIQCEPIDSIVRPTEMSAVA